MLLWIILAKCVQCNAIYSMCFIIHINSVGCVCDKMEDIYRAKHSFCGVSKEKTSKNNCEFITIARSMPTSPNSSRTVKYQNEKHCQNSRPDKSKKSEGVSRSPILNVKLEKSSSEPNVFESETSKTNNYNSSHDNSNEVSPCNSNSFEEQLTGDTITNNAESLFLSFQEGDLFQVLSKVEHKNWWAVRSIKQNAVGFVPANYMQLSENDSKSQMITGPLPGSHQPPEEALAGLRARVAAVAATATAFAAARAAAASAASVANAPAHARSNAHDSREAEDAVAEADAAAAAAAESAAAGTLFPEGMIPEPELCGRGGGAGGTADLDRRNRRNQHIGAMPAALAAAAGAHLPPPAAPPLPPPPPFSPEGLILPRKLHNPVLESNDHKNLRRELLFNQKMGKNVLNQKSELQKAFGKHKEQQVRKELELQRQNAKSDFERMVEERARRMDLLEKERTEESDKCSQGESEFLKVHAKMRARMDSK